MLTYGKRNYRFEYYIFFYSLYNRRLDSNALICDCSIMGLAQMLAEHPGAEAAAYCEQPSNMHGKSVMAMNDLGIRCRKCFLLHIMFDYGFRK